MSQFNTISYSIEKPTGVCGLTGRHLEPRETYVATLVEAHEPIEDDPQRSRWTLRRVDVAVEAWDAGRRPEGLFSHWKAVVPKPDERKKLFVDDAVLINLFRRLEDARDERRLAFRFVLALILMRKKLLKYEGMTRAPRREHIDPPPTRPSSSVDTSVDTKLEEEGDGAERDPGQSPDAGQPSGGGEAACEAQAPARQTAEEDIEEDIVEIWIMAHKEASKHQPAPDAERSRVVNPHLDEAQIQQVTEQLGEVLQAEL